MKPRVEEIILLYRAVVEFYDMLLNEGVPQSKLQWTLINAVGMTKKQAMKFKQEEYKEDLPNGFETSD